MSVSGGYVTDVGYTAGFYAETAPAHLAYAALAAGRAPGRALMPSRVLELGFGQGFGLALLAAANPHIAFEGHDFNADHVAHARELIDRAGLSNLTVAQTGFTEAAARGGDRDVDLVILHGVFGWLAPSVQGAILDIIRQRLRENGRVFVSYNCMPGWAPLAPIRQLVGELKRHIPGGSEAQVAAALDVLGALRRGNAPYFVANPSAARHVDEMLNADRAYLAHEYLAEHWDHFHFADLAARLRDAGLSYVATAVLVENFADHAVPQHFAPLVARFEDPVVRETLRDLIANRRFRRDLFGRGDAALDGPEQRRLLSRFSFALTVPRSRVSLTFRGPFGAIPVPAELYGPIVDLLAKHNASFDQLAALPPFGQAGSAVLLACLALLVDSGQILAFVPAAADPRPAKRFNRMVAESVKKGRVYGHLASPVAGTGLPVNDFALLALAAAFDDQADEPASAAQHALATVKGLGRRPSRDGRPIQDDAEALRFLAEHMTPVVEEQIPLWRRLGVL